MIAVLGLAVAAAARGDTLAEVRAALRPLAGRAPIAATYEVRQTNRAHGKFFDQDLDTSAAAAVRGDEQGVTVTIGRDLLDRARSHAANAGLVSASRIAELLDFAPSLLARLEKAVVVKEGPGLLTLRIPPEQAGKGVDVKTRGDEFSLRIGADHIPIAAERRAKFSIGFLFLKAEADGTDRWTFVRHGDRLVVTRYQKETNGSGMGEQSHGTELETLTLH
jgi:hypothetical protein